MASAHDAYLESTVLSADPVELIRILYRLAMDRTTEAKRHLETGDVAARGRAISGASQAIAELARSLDFEAGGELSQRLAALYQYMQLRLVEANYHRSAEPLNEVLGLLHTLAEAWEHVKPQPQAPSAWANPWQEEVPAGELETAGWRA